MKGHKKAPSPQVEHQKDSEKAPSPLVEHQKGSEKVPSPLVEHQKLLPYFSKSLQNAVGFFGRFACVFKAFTSLLVATGGGQGGLATGVTTEGLVEGHIPLGGLG